MHLPPELPQAQLLIAAKTYPLPSNKYSELVCTAGFLPDGTWVRLYPVPFRALSFWQQYEKFEWITVDLVRNTKDFRPESYRPKHGAEAIVVGEKVDTKKGWAKRKEYALKEIFTSMQALITCAYGNNKKSLATLKPREIVGFVIEEEEEREWKPQWRNQLLQYNLFDLNEKGEGKERQVVPKLPYRYSYRFLTEGDTKPRQMVIKDWEIGGLYWNCLRQCEGDEREANKLVEKKFFEEFCQQKDLYFFLGTTEEFHRRRATNPFILIGVFYPPKVPPKAAEQLVLF